MPLLRIACRIAVASLALGGAAVPAGAVGDAAPLELPSGGEVTLQEVVWGEPGPAGLTVRFRFLDPALAARLNGALDTEPDMAYLCEAFALPRIAKGGPQPNQVIISIADAPVEFGAPAPDVAQIFEAYRPDEGRCIWEGF